MMRALLEGCVNLGWTKTSDVFGQYGILILFVGPTQQ